MATASSSILFSLNGVDKTAGAFNSVQKRAQSAMSKLRGVAMAAGLGLSFGAIAYGAKKAVDAMGELTDHAQRMSSSVEDVQKLTGALDMVGVVGVNVDALAKAFERMSKETGAVGVRGFRDVMQSIAGMGSEQERVNELVRVFGREMGAKFAPMVRQGPQAFIEGLDGVMAMMPAVTGAAAEAADGASDALKLAGNTITVAWQQAVGDMVAEFEDVFGVSFEEGIYTAIEYVKWFATSAWKHFKAWCKNIWAGAAAVVDDWRGALESIGLMFAGAFNAIGRLAKEFGKQLWKWVKGEGAMDWKAVWQEAVDGYKAVGESEFGKGIAWSVVDDAALARARDAAIEIKKAGIEAAKKLASGGVEADATIAKAANEATKAVKDSAKEAAYVSAGSYAALKIGMNKPATSDKTPEIAATLKQLLTVTRDGWKSMTELEAI
jgi:hypothetical protein